MKRYLIVLLSMVICYLIYAENLSPYVRVSMKSGEVLNGRLHVDMNGDVFQSIDHSGEFETLRDGTTLFPPQASDFNTGFFTLYTETVHLPWSYYYISESKRELSLSQIESISWQSENQPFEFKIPGNWYEMGRKDYQMLQKGIYGFIVLPGESAENIFVRTDPMLTAEEWMLYATLMINDRNVVTYNKSDFPFLSSLQNQKEFEEFSVMLNTQPLDQSHLNFIDKRIAKFEKYVPLIERNRIITEKSRRNILKELNKSINYLRRFRYALESNIGSKYTGILVNKFPQELVPLAKNSKLSSSFYIRLADQLLNPDIFKDQLEIVDESDRVLKEIGIIRLLADISLK